MKTGETRLCHGAYLELGHFFSGPLIAVLFRYARTIWAFRLFERFLVYLWRELINLYSRRGVMKFRDDTYALGTARGEEVEAVELIDLFLVMLGEPVLRGRESIFVFELHIRGSKRKPDQPLRDFGNAIRRGMFHQWRISERERVVRNRIHVPALQRLFARNNDILLTKKSPMKRQKINTACVRAIHGQSCKKQRCFAAISCRGV